MKLRDAILRISAAKCSSSLPIIDRLLVPVLSVCSRIYSGLVSSRKFLYNAKILEPKRLPIPVVSVGNVTWGGNGKTPMTEFLATCFVRAGINPLILSRGYGGGDEAKLLEKHMEKLPVKIGIGADRYQVASLILSECGVFTAETRRHRARFVDVSEQLSASYIPSPKDKFQIGVAILDDAMQHLQMARDIEIVMVNALTLFGNERMIPRGPLREPLDSLKRANVLVIHHANLVSEQRLQEIKLFLYKQIHNSQPAWICSEMVPQHFYKPLQAKTVPLSVVHGAVVLCISGVGCPQSLSFCLGELGAAMVHRLDYPDHHDFQSQDIMSMDGLRLNLMEKYGDNHCVVVVTTEKDYMRRPAIWKHVDVLVLCSSLKLWSSPGLVDFNAILTNAMA